MKPEIIELTESHVPTINSIYSVAFPSPYTQVANRVKTRNPEYWRLYLSKSHPFSLGIQFHNKLIGFSFIHFWGDYLWIGPIAILPEYQGQGFGRKMLQEQVQQALLNRTCYLLALESSTPVSTLAFYLHSSFNLLNVSLKLLLNHSVTPPNECHFQKEILAPHYSNHHPFLDQLIQNHHMDLKNEIESFILSGLGKAWYVQTSDHSFQALVFWIQDMSPTKDSSYLTYKCILADPIDPYRIQQLFRYLAREFLQLGYRISLLTLQSQFQNLLPLFPATSYKLIQYTFLMTHRSSTLDLPKNLFYAFSWNG